MQMNFKDKSQSFYSQSMNHVIVLVLNENVGPTLNYNHFLKRPALIV